MRPCVTAIRHLFVTGAFALIIAATASAADDSPPATVGGQWFLSFTQGDTDGATSSQFSVNRGYIIIKKQLTDRIAGRITPDISVDREGDGEGDLEMRLKYCYVDVSMDDFWVLTDPAVEFGLVHRPWLGYEETIFRYRVQGSLFMERNGVFNSADFGIMASALLGGEIDEEFQEGVNSKAPGRYGSVALGIYNGGGYHALEQNENKSFESRITLRPLPDQLPGIQITYFGVIGKGNTAAEPDWTVNALHISYEDRLITTAGQYYSGTGDYKGKQVDVTGSPLDMTGYSVSAELHPRSMPYTVAGRYDWFDDMPGSDGNNRERIIACVSWRLLSGVVERGPRRRGLHDSLSRDK